MGVSEVFLLQNVLGMRNVLEVVLTQELEVLSILKGGAKGFHPLKGCVQNV